MDTTENMSVTLHQDTRERDGRESKENFNKEDLTDEADDITLEGFDAVFCAKVYETLEPAREEAFKNISAVIEGLSKIPIVWRPFKSGAIAELQNKQPDIAEDKKKIFMAHCIALFNEAAVSGLIRLRMFALAEKVQKKKLKADETGLADGLKLLESVFSKLSEAPELTENAQRELELIFAKMAEKDAAHFAKLHELFNMTLFPYAIKAATTLYSDSAIYSKESEPEVVRQQSVSQRTGKAWDFAAVDRRMSFQISDPGKIHFTRKVNYLFSVVDTICDALRVVAQVKAIEITRSQKFNQELIEDAVRANTESDIDPQCREFIRTTFVNEEQNTPLELQRLKLLQFSAGLKAELNDFFTTTPKQSKIPVFKPIKVDSVVPVTISQLFGVVKKSEMIIGPSSAPSVRMLYGAIRKIREEAREEAQAKAIAIQAQAVAIDKAREASSNAAGIVLDVNSLRPVAQDRVRYEVVHAKATPTGRSLRCPTPKEREKISALLYYAPHLSPLVAVTMISSLRMTAAFYPDKEATIIRGITWGEMGVVVVGYGLGVRALLNPKNPLNLPARLYESLVQAGILFNNAIGTVSIIYIMFYPKFNDPNVELPDDTFINIMIVPATIAASLGLIWNSIPPGLYCQTHNDAGRRMEMLYRTLLYSGITKIVGRQILEVSKQTLIEIWSKALFEFIPYGLGGLMAYLRSSPVVGNTLRAIFFNAIGLDSAVTMGRNLMPGSFDSDILPNPELTLRRILWLSLAIIGPTTTAVLSVRFVRRYQMEFATRAITLNSETSVDSNAADGSYLSLDQLESARDALTAPDGEGELSSSPTAARAQEMVLTAYRHHERKHRNEHDKQLKAPFLPAEQQPDHKESDATLSGDKPKSTPRESPCPSFKCTIL